MRCDVAAADLVPPAVDRLLPHWQAPPMRERTYTTEEAARRLGVPAGRIADWKHRGRIVPAGYLHGRGDGVPVYLLEELRPLAQQWAKRTATRPKKA